jgi:hypothetical protein
MIAGLGPILGEDTVGFFINPAGFWSGWEYSGFASRVNGNVAQSVTNPYTLRTPGPKVAVLIDGRVASSGEAAAIAFKQRPNTRFFGTPTCGLSTANVTFPIDGASLVLTVAKMADRTRFVYGDTLVPDEFISNVQDQLDRAITWLHEPASVSASRGDVNKLNALRSATVSRPPLTNLENHGAVSWPCAASRYGKAITGPR